MILTKVIDADRKASKYDLSLQIGSIPFASVMRSQRHKIELNLGETVCRDVISLGCFVFVSVCQKMTQERDK